MEGRLIEDGSICDKEYALLNITDDRNNIWAAKVGFLVHSDTTEEDVRRLYPKGALVRITGTTPNRKDRTILAENPAMVQVCTNFSDVAFKLYNNMNADQVRTQGKLLFSKGRLEATLELYTLSIDKLRSQESPDKQSILHSLVDRAECLLKMERFEEAYETASSALEIDDRHVKSLILHGKALFHLQEYVLATESLSKALEYGGRNEKPELQTALDKARTFSAQSNSGDYRKHIDDAVRCLGEDVPNCSDYIGPVVFGRKNRGTRTLLAAKAIKESSLVMVSKAIVVARLKPGDRPAQLIRDVACKLFRACMRSRELTHQLHELARLDKAELPSLLAFKPNKITSGFKLKEGEYAELPDQRLILSIATVHSIDCYTMSSKGEETAEAEFRLLPSFFQTSCIPNLSELNIGLTSFFHANRDISAGEELTIGWSETDLFLPRSVRLDSVLRMPRCSCRRCQAEEAYESKLKKATKVLKKLRERVTDQDDVKASEAAAKLVPEIEVAIKDAPEEHKHYIRTSFVHAYVHFFRLRHRKEAVAKLVVNEILIPSPQEVIQALRHCLPGSPFCLRLIYRLNREELTYEDISKFIGDAEDPVLAEAGRQAFSRTGIFSLINC